MSKTLEEIAEKISYNPAQTSLILAALRAVERQTVERERERTCEWVEDVDDAYTYIPACDKSWRIPMELYGGPKENGDVYCRSCGGLIVCKEKGEGTTPLHPCEPFKNREGDMCGLCDGTTEHEHPQSKCLLCGVEGLAENMRKHECKKPTGRQWK